MEGERTACAYPAYLVPVRSRLNLIFLDGMASNGENY
jgi:hypothetical protein